jgi:hypothetical protein
MDRGLQRRAAVPGSLPVPFHRRRSQAKVWATPPSRGNLIRPAQHRPEGRRAWCGGRRGLRQSYRPTALPSSLASAQGAPAVHLVDPMGPVSTPAFPRLRVTARRWSNRATGRWCRGPSDRIAFRGGAARVVMPLWGWLRFALLAHPSRSPAVAGGGHGRWPGLHGHRGAIGGAGLRPDGAARRGRAAFVLSRGRRWRA